MRRRLWRLGLALGLLGGTLYVANSPAAVVVSDRQLIVNGNKILPDEALRKLQQGTLHHAILAIDPRAVEQEVAQHPLIRRVQVRRQLVPPRVIAWVEERQPIARTSKDGKAGFVDIEGVWLSKDLFARSQSRIAPPALQLYGWEHHPPADWATVLAAVERSHMAIASIDWRSSSNLILQTKLGKVHLGPLQASFPASETPLPSPTSTPATADRSEPTEMLSLADQLDERLQTLERMGNLPQYCDCAPQDIAYIDLTSPLMPTIALTDEAARKRFAPPPTDPDHP